MHSNNISLFFTVSLVKETTSSRINSFELQPFKAIFENQIRKMAKMFKNSENGRADNQKLHAKPPEAVNEVLKAELKKIQSISSNRLDK